MNLHIGLQCILLGHPGYLLRLPATLNSSPGFRFCGFVPNCKILTLLSLPIHPSSSPGVQHGGAFGFIPQFWVLRRYILHPLQVYSMAVHLDLFHSSGVLRRYILHPLQVYSMAVHLDLFHSSGYFADTSFILSRCTAWRCIWIYSTVLGYFADTSFILSRCTAWRCIWIYSTVLGYKSW